MALLLLMRVIHPFAFPDRAPFTHPLGLHHKWDAPLQILISAFAILNFRHNLRSLRSFASLNSKLKTSSIPRSTRATAPAASPGDPASTPAAAPTIAVTIPFAIASCPAPFLLQIRPQRLAHQIRGRQMPLPRQPCKGPLHLPRHPRLDLLVQSSVHLFTIVPQCDPPLQ